MWCCLVLMRACMLNTAIKNYDYTFTCSKGAFLNQNQVEKILNPNDQEENVFYLFYYI